MFLASLPPAARGLGLLLGLAHLRLARAHRPGRLDHRHHALVRAVEDRAAVLLAHGVAERAERQRGALALDDRLQELAGHPLDGLRLRLAALGLDVAEARGAGDRGEAADR